ncbi:MAG: 3-phosphoshikimate 1-carboxyvinyltransferase [Phycisphaerae bacterium]
MDIVVGKSSGLHGSVRIPPNKSHSFRALIMAGLADGSSRILSPMVSHDWMLGTEAFEMFGARVTPRAEEVWEVEGVAGQLKTPEDVVNCGNSGIILRFFAAMATCCEGYTVLTGDDSLRHIRPCQPLLDALNNLGAWGVSTKSDGHAPLVVRGRLRGGSTKIDGMDSQPVSALLIAAALADAPTELLVERPGEKPWVGLTIDWLQRCGVELSNDRFEHFRVRGKHHWPGFEVRIPLDWSAALYPIAAGVLTEDSEVVVPGMNMGDSQGDKGVLDVLQAMGANIELSDQGIIARSSQLTGMEIDCNDFIDQLPLLAVIGARAEGETTLRNAEICRHKECDRITEMARALKAMGAKVEELPDGLKLRHSQLHSASLDSRADHRMVMTLTVAAMTAEGKTRITQAEAVKKTFPHFADQMLGLGGYIETSH